MNMLTLNGAVYTSHQHPFRSGKGSLKACWEQVNADLHHHISVLGLTSQKTDCKIPHFLCSTINGTSFSTGQISWAIAAQLINKDLIFPVNTYLDAYECASWGYALRYLFQRKSSSNQILISIMDINFFDFDYWIKSPHWGKSGFGILTILLEASNDAKAEDIIAGCTMGNSIVEFGFAIRKAIQENQAIAALPFFPENAREILMRVVGREGCLRDLHECWGHSFGSDPWISIIQHLNEKLDRDMSQMYSFLACSLAFNGYFVIAKVTVPSNAILRLN